MFYKFIKYILQNRKSNAYIIKNPCKSKVYTDFIQSTFAERTRFELVVRVITYGSLANCWFQPLTHLSKSILSALCGLQI